MTADAARFGEPADDIDLEIDLLLEAIARKYSYEFRDYARASVRRRVTGALSALNVDSVSMLQHRILRDRMMFTALLTHLTVPVSDLFRDPAYFLGLRRDVLPVLQTYPSLKIWVAGCSTGEEAYSLAIVLDEEGLLARTHIYATDISPESLRKANAGIYALERTRQFTQWYQRAGGTRSLADYYTAAYDSIVFDRRLHQHITFSDHSLATDSVFAEVQLVSCRNVLIYFNSTLQDRAITLFRDSLVPRGFLGLGSHERLGHSPAAGEFDVVLRAERIYQRRGV